MQGVGCAGGAGGVGGAGDAAGGGGGFEPNDLLLTPIENFQVIMGANAAGKSTFLKQTALVVVLAQIGCAVPARFASIRLCDRVFTRIGTSDSLETNASSFALEMAETAFILDTVTDRSLVLVDELGRSTANEDGIGIAWAVSEKLVFSRAYVLFATHYHQLARLASLYSRVKCSYFAPSLPRAIGAGGAAGDGMGGGMGVGVGGGGGAAAAFPGGNAHRIHVVGAGDDPLASLASEDYGIRMAAACGFPPHCVADARRIRRALHEKMSAVSARRRRRRISAGGVGAGSAGGAGGAGGAGDGGAGNGDGDDHDDASDVTAPSPAHPAIRSAAAMAKTGKRQALIARLLALRSSSLKGSHLRQYLSQLASGES